MPSCRPDVISEVLYLVMGMRPKTILDVGVGHGKWGVLCTEYLKYWQKLDVIIDGVEPFEDYRTSVWESYRVVFHDDVMNLLDQFENYDLVLAVDVIEHLEKADGLKFLNAVKGHYIVSTPDYWMPQGAEFGNRYEKHRSTWMVNDFANSMLVNDKVGRSHIIGFR